MEETGVIDGVAGQEEVLEETGVIDGVPDQNNVTQEEKTEFQVREEEGQRKAIIAERQRRQQAEAALSEVSQKVNNLEQMFYQEDDSEDDIVTKKDLKQFFQEEQRQRDEKARLKIIKTSVTSASKKYNDFEEVRVFANELLSQEQMNIIALSEDPGEMLYQFGKMHPNYKASENAETVKQTIDSIQSNLKKPKTLSNASGTSNQVLDEIAKLQSMTDDEIRKMGDSVLGK